MSSVWKYFDRMGKDQARCRKCPKMLSCKGSSTSSLLNHIRNIHNIDIPSKLHCDDEGAIPSSSKIHVNNPLTKYVSKNESIGEIFARCVAEDGISVRALRKSRVVLAYLQARNYNMPAESTIWSNIDMFYLSKKEELKNKLNEIKEHSGRFSIVVDEWSDLSYKKYINVTVRTYSAECKSFNIFNLGLEEVTVKGSAENLEMLIKKKLSEFSLHFERDIVASTHDGAPVMQKYGRNIQAVSQLCIIHGIHLCVVEAIYTEKDFDMDDNHSSNESDFYEENSEMCDEFANEDEDTDIYFCFEQDLCVNGSLKFIIDRVRKCVKMFNKSNEKQKKLQMYVKEQENKELKLIHDVKHRWNSMTIMVSQFLKLHKCVNHALLDLGLSPFNENDIKTLNELNNTLKPLEIAVKELSKNSSTLIEAEGIFQFLFKSLSKLHNPLSNELLECLKKRVEERRIKVLNTLMLYLSSGTFPSSDNFLKYSSKSETKEFGSMLYFRLFNDTSDTTSDSNEEVHISDCENNLELELSNTIKNIVTAKTICKRNNKNILLEDFLYLEKCHKRTEKLEKLLNALYTVNPSSILSERAFSMSGFIKTKQKNRYNAKHLDRVLFLRDYFKRETKH